MKTSDILNRAADIIIEGGHCKLQERTSGGAHCLFGAIRLAANLGKFSAAGWMEYQEFPGYAQLVNVTGDIRPWNWNDSPDTTEAMALGALHDAARLAKEAGD